MCLPSFFDVPDRALDQHPDIPLVQEHNLRRDGMRRILDLGGPAAEQCRLEMEDGLFLLGVDLGAQEDEAVGLAQAGVERRPAAADHDLLARVLDDLEMVGEPQALGKFGDGELRRAPEVVVGARRLVIPFLEKALGLET